MAEISQQSKEDKLAQLLRAVFEIEATVQRDRRVWTTVPKNELVSLCRFARGLGFDHLSAISVTDWPKDGTFELTYHLWSYSLKILLTVKTKTKRADPQMDSAMPIFHENAQIHERELHELFGVKFRGNPDVAPLFLEDWHGPPPFRKDFNWRDYVRQRCYDKSEEREKPYWQ
ncbi:MAG: NADH-quinone oxidoreductase subunit C [Thermodesulfobacteriota bacterium]|nr:NADH-quinone oxidoreductase subunit C [Thermodesulfobacteriota bacterium]